MSSAITSALGAMRPQLLQMAKQEPKGTESEKEPSAETLVRYKIFAEGLINQYQTYSGEHSSFEHINWVKFAEWFLAQARRSEVGKLADLSRRSDLLSAQHSG